MCVFKEAGLKREELDNLLRQALQQVAITTDDLVSILIEGSNEMRANEDAQVYEHLYSAFKEVLDPNVFPTIIAPQGHKKVIEIGKLTLEVTVTHREPRLEKITGVDVFYYLKDWKVLAFQHKKRSKDGSLRFGEREREQRDKIMQLCDACSVASKKFGRDISFLKPLCASVYVIGDSEGGHRHVISACQIEAYRKRYPRHGGTSLVPSDSNWFFRLPLPGDLATVDRMFLQSTIGRRLQREKDKTMIRLMKDASLAAPNLLITADLS